MSIAASTDGWTRDARVIGSIGVAHGVSHFYQLALAPLFPAIITDLDVSYTALGFAITLMYAISGLCQPLAGFVVDRFGGYRVLVAGLVLGGVGTALAGLAPNYPTLLAAVAIVALGNSVYHPADFSILNNAVSDRRIGRAFSVHGVFGTLGYALAPAVAAPLALALGWRGALVAMGCVGLAMALVIVFERDLLRSEQPAREGEAPPPPLSARALFQVPVLLCFAFFVLLAMAQIGQQTFLVATLGALYGIAMEHGQLILTTLLLGGAAGVLFGGILADRTSRHDLVATTGLLVGAAVALVLATGAVPAPLLVFLLGLSGFCIGTTNPSRDMLIRAVTPKGSSGRVYGFVYSGLDIGSAATPVVFGWLLDHGHPQTIFVAVGAVLAVAVVTVMGVGREARAYART
ncbi:MAG: MFS transporter [Hyphomicrobium sp.]|nr:MFS transporter [Hyphomicrobium sp.]